MTDTTYYRPIAQTDALCPEDGLRIGGGRTWFSQAEVLCRGQSGRLISATEIPASVQARLSDVRSPICGLSMETPRIMGVLNATPDSFSDGGLHYRFDRAVARAMAMVTEGADIIDIGGESTRPGSDAIEVDEEISRTVPVIAELKAMTCPAPISIDTRKADVAGPAIAAGATMINDVTALEYDPQMMGAAAKSGLPVCLMHTGGDPKTMQVNPQYDDVLLDIYDYLEARIVACEQAGISRDRIVVDPGIGFGKTMDHNLALIRGLSLFHGLGCPLLLGVSRKRFIGEIGQEPLADRRAPGSIAIGLECLRQGAQILRVHDTRQTRQAVSLWQAVH